MSGSILSKYLATYLDVSGQKLLFEYCMWLREIQYLINYCFVEFCSNYNVNHFCCNENIFWKTPLNNLALQLKICSVLFTAAVKI